LMFLLLMLAVVVAVDYDCLASNLVSCKVCLIGGNFCLK
jgi:hypothetical protein